MTDDERVAAGIAYLEFELTRHAGALRMARISGFVHGVNTKWPVDIQEALDLMQAAQDLPDALDRITTLANLYVLGADRDRRSIWSKILARMGLSNPRDHLGG